MSRMLSFSSRSAWLQYHILMVLFRLAVTRGLYGRFARGLGRIFDSENAVSVSQSVDTPPFKIYLNDGYWTRFSLYHRDYEPEIDKILCAARGATPLFCDLGANKGYWTTRAAPLFDQVVAVEASGRTFLRLSENAGDLPNVTLHHAAIHRHSGKVMRFINTHLSHASARLGEALNPGDTWEEIETIRIDDLVPAGLPALIKLDVEGAEIAAIDGAARALSDGAVLIYEDHGSDTDHTPSRHLLSDPDIRVYYCENSMVQITDPDQLQRFKSDRFKGYNLLTGRRDSELLKAVLQGFANP